MGLESATFINDLNSAWPLGTDPKSAGDDHIRRVKATLRATFPLITAAVSVTHAELNRVSGLVSNVQTELNALAAGKANAGVNSDITSLSGLTTPLSVAQGGTGVNNFANAALTANGYQYLPNGLIIQWGTVTSVAYNAAAQAFSFPLAFPNACFVVLHSGYAAMAITEFADIVIKAFNAAGVTDYNASTNLLFGTLNFRWIAIGH